jgi:hypothetical protein
LEEIGVDERTTLKWILKQHDGRGRIRWIWPRYWKVVGCCEHGNEPSSSITYGESDCGTVSFLYRTRLHGVIYVVSWLLVSWLVCLFVCLYVCLFSVEWNREFRNSSVHFFKISWTATPPHTWSAEFWHFSLHVSAWTRPIALLSPK